MGYIGVYMYIYIYIVVYIVGSMYGEWDVYAIYIYDDI